MIRRIRCIASRGRRSIGASIGLRPTSFPRLPLVLPAPVMLGTRSIGRPSRSIGWGATVTSGRLWRPYGSRRSAIPRLPPTATRLPWRAVSWESWPAGATVTRRPRFRGPPPALRRPRLRHHLLHRRRPHHRRRPRHRRVITRGARPARAARVVAPAMMTT